MPDTIWPGVRIDERRVNDILDRLDAGATGLGNLRCSQRYSYRNAALLVEIPRGDVPVRYSVPGRNLGRDGISFLLGGFVYPGTSCRVRLVSEHNISCDVPGRVVRCHYAEGSPHIHEVGVGFDAPIDIAVFHRGASTVRVLLVDDDTSRKQVLEHLLKRYNADVSAVDSIEDALAAALSSPFDLVVVNFESPSIRCCELNARLRSEGYVRPIVSLALSPVPRFAEHCSQRSCDACEPAPFTREALVALVSSLRNEPVVSSLARERAMASVINQFVSDAMGAVRDLEQAFRSKQFEQLGNVLRRLRAFAEYSGFDVIVYRADALLATLRPPQAEATLRALLTHLVRACLGARPASQLHVMGAGRRPIALPTA